MLGVKIQNRNTKKYATKGINSWNERGKVWSTLRDAKLAICPKWWRYKCHIDYNLLNSDFIIVNDDATIEKEPCINYILDYLNREKVWGYIYPEVLEEIRNYCKKNNIEIKEDL